MNSDNNNNLDRIYGGLGTRFITENNRGLFEAQARIRAELERAVPDVPTVRAVPAGSVRPIDWKALNEEEDDNRVSNRYGEARGRKRPSALLDQDEQTAVHPRTYVVRLEQPPWKLPRSEERDKGKGVLREGGELHSVSPIRSDSDEDDVDDGDWASGVWGDLSSLDDSQDGWGAELSRPSVAWSRDQGVTTFDETAYRTDMRTACDGLRASIRMGQVPSPITLWSNEYGQDDSRGEPIAPSPVYAPFRPPRGLEGGSHGGDPGRHVVRPPSRRGTDPSVRHCNGIECACPVPCRNASGGSSEDRHD